jgi:hypothetical protein
VFSAAICVALAGDGDLPLELLARAGEPWAGELSLGEEARDRDAVGLREGVMYDGKLEDGRSPPGAHRLGGVAYIRERPESCGAGDGGHGQERAEQPAQRPPGRAARRAVVRGHLRHALSASRWPQCPQNAAVDGAR